MKNRGDRHPAAAIDEEKGAGFPARPEVPCATESGHVPDPVA